MICGKLSPAGPCTEYNLNKWGGAMLSEDSLSCSTGSVDRQKNMEFYGLYAKPQDYPSCDQSTRLHVDIRRKRHSRGAANRSVSGFFWGIEDDQSILTRV